MVAGVDPAAVLPLHADVGRAGVVPLEHRAVGAFDAWNRWREIAGGDRVCPVGGA